jgi:hypothetical protein
MCSVRVTVSSLLTSGIHHVIVDLNSVEFSDTVFLAFKLEFLQTREFFSATLKQTLLLLNSILPYIQL